MMFTFALTQIINFAVAYGQPCDPRKANPDSGLFFGIPHWWEYIKTGEGDVNGNCSPKVVMPDGLWAIGLAAVDILLTLAGIVAVISIIVAGISYMTTLGNAEKGVSARRRIVNSLIGLGIVIIASAVVSFIGSQLIK